MSRFLPLPLKGDLNAEATGATLAMLLSITDATLPEPLNLTSSAAKLLSADPLAYGIVSGGVTYAQALAGLSMPDDKDATPLGLSIVIDDVGENDGYGALIKGLSYGALASIAFVSEDAPDVTFYPVTNLRFTKRTRAEDGTVTIDLSRDRAALAGAQGIEPFIAIRQTKNYAPGLWR